MCRTGSPGLFSGLTGALRVQRSAGAGGVADREGTGAGERLGARSKSAARLRVDFPDDESMRISHEAIYQSLYVQGRGALRRELTACLRTGRAPAGSEGQDVEG